jgi:hypothetical protein
VPCPTLVQFFARRLSCERPACRSAGKALNKKTYFSAPSGTPPSSKLDAQLPIFDAFGFKWRGHSWLRAFDSRVSPMCPSAGISLAGVPHPLRVWCLQRVGPLMLLLPWHLISPLSAALMDREPSRPHQRSRLGIVIVIKHRRRR